MFLLKFSQDNTNNVSNPLDFITAATKGNLFGDISFL